MKLYHGSPSQHIKEFTLENEPRYSSVEGRGIYLTTSYKLARGYAGSEGSVYVCELSTQVIFDATTEDEFIYLIEQASKKINYKINEVDYFKETINGLVSGDYRISDEQSDGFLWQIKNLLFNTEDFCAREDSDELIEKLSEFVKDYMSQHPVLKYQDKTLGLIYLGKDADYIKIVEEIMVGSSKDEEML